MRIFLRTKFLSIYSKASRPKGMILGLVIISLAVMGFIIAYSLKHSHSLMRISQVESKAKQRELKARQEFYNIKSALLTNINAAIQTQISNGNPMSGGSPPSFAASDLQLGSQFTNRNVDYTITCLHNCSPAPADTTGTPALTLYPKTFLIRLSQLSDNKREVTSVTGTVDVIQSKFSDYSTLITDTTASEVWFGQGNHGKVGVFWDLSNAPGIIRFMNISQGSGATPYLNIQKLVTNTSLTNVDYGKGSLNAGPVTVREGFLTGTSPASNLTANFANMVPTAIHSDLYPTTIPDSCNLNLGSCAGTTCQIQMYDTYQGVQHKIYPTAGTSAVIPANSVLYTDAAKCTVGSLDGPGVPIYFDTSNITFIGRGNFTLTASVQGNPNLTEDQKGNVAFVSLSDNAVVIDHNTVSESASSTFGQFAAGTASVTDTTETFRFEAAAIAVASGHSALSIDSSILGSTGSNSTFGTLAVSGPLWGATQSITRMIDQTTGNIVSGFNWMNSQFPERWTTRPPPGLNAVTSADHDAVITGLSINTGSISEALSEVGLSWDTNFTPSGQ